MIDERNNYNHKIIRDGENNFQIENNYEGINRIIVSNATAKWTTDAQSNNALENINLTIRARTLTAIIGPVGAGKVHIKLILI